MSRVVLLVAYIGAAFGFHCAARVKLCSMKPYAMSMLLQPGEPGYKRQKVARLFSSVVRRVPVVGRRLRKVEEETWPCIGGVGGYHHMAGLPKPPSKEKLLAALKIARLKAEGEAVVTQRESIQFALKIACLKAEGEAVIVQRVQAQHALKVARLKAEGAEVVARRASLNFSADCSSVLISWHDSGIRLASVQEWPAIGGKAGPHRMAGTMTPPQARELWIPPPGWEPPSKPATSGYDEGERLSLPGTIIRKEQGIGWNASMMSPKKARTEVMSWYDQGVRLTPKLIATQSPGATPGATPKPVSTVTSWYDQGLRLNSKAEIGVAQGTKLAQRAQATAVAAGKLGAAAGRALNALFSVAEESEPQNGTGVSDGAQAASTAAEAEEIGSVTTRQAKEEAEAEAFAAIDAAEEQKAREDITAEAIAVAALNAFSGVMAVTPEVVAAVADPDPTDRPKIMIADQNGVAPDGYEWGGTY